MCVQYMAIKSRSRYGVKKAFIPCGKCEECRQSLKNQWSFRLRVELDWCKKNKWHIGFFTLTYSDDCLPHIPKCCFKNDSDFRPIPCFSRSDCRTFIDNIRKRLNERYSLGNSSRVRYLLAQEYGSHTKRPHMHGLLAFPPSVPPNEVFALIKSNWTKGHVFPRYMNGGVDSRGYQHKPFLITADSAGAAAYAAKYCTKDLDYYDSIKGIELLPLKLTKDCMPHHIQSKSIGLQALSLMDTDDLLKALQKGVSFVGMNKTLSLPLYLKNKILYNVKYSFELCPTGDWWYDFECDKWRYKKGAGTHKRIVEREATDFFIENVKTLYAQKCDYYEDLFEKMRSNEFWRSRQLKDGYADRIPLIYSQMADFCGFSPRRLAEGFVSYYGVSRDKAKCVPNELMWLSRFCSRLKWKDTHPLVNDVYYDNLHKIISFICDALKMCVTLDVKKRAKLAKLLDFYHHYT